MRHNMNKLRDQETFNPGQSHSVMRVIYQNANTLPRYGRGAAPGVDLRAQQNANVTADLPGANTAPGRLRAFPAPD